MADRPSQDYRRQDYRRAASDLRSQFEGLLPDRAAPVVEKVAGDANDMMLKVLDYVRLAAEYREPIAALVRQFTGKAERAATVAMHEAEALPDRSSSALMATGRWLGRHPAVAIGAAAVIGLAVFAATRSVRRRNV